MELSERLPQVRIDEKTMERLQERIASGTGNLSDHVRRAVELYVADATDAIALSDETMLALQWAGTELAISQGKPLLSLDAMVRALIAHWNATKQGPMGRSVALGVLPSGVLELGYS